MSDLPAQLRAELDSWTAAGLRRSLQLPAGVDFTSNDYLGLARDPRLVAAAAGALERYGTGAPAARLLRGHLEPHAQAEAAAANWLQSEAALLFPSGWQANLAVLTTFAGHSDAVLSDAANHASLIDGCRLSRAAVHVYPHGDLTALERLLGSAARARRRLIVTESIFSMDGDPAPLPEIEALARRHDAWLLVDEAHAAGLYGPGGAGRAAALGQDARVLMRVVTGGKALGVSGAFAAGSRTAVDLLLNKGRAFVFTTAVPPAVAAALAAAIAVVRSEPERAQAAHEAAARLRAALGARGFYSAGDSPIVPVLLGSPERAVRVAERVRAQGFDVRAVRPPTVPAGTSRLRLVCHAGHAPAEIDALANAVADAAHAVPASAHEPVAPAPRCLVVAGTDTGVGKTTVAALLLRAACRAGRRAAYWKPVQTGAESDTERVRALAGLEPFQMAQPAFALPLPASVDQAAAAAGAKVGVREVLAASPLDTPGDSRLWIVECAGGLRVPWNEEEDQADFLTRLRAPLLLVARSGLGTLNHCLLTLESAAARRLPVQGLFLVGPPHPDNAATLRARLTCPLFELPHLDPLDAAALDTWLAQHALEDLLP